jgi:hypothetical protein
MTLTKATARATKVEQARGTVQGYVVIFDVIGDGIPPQQIRVDVPGRGGMDLGEAEKAARKSLDKFCREIAPVKPILPTVRARMALPPKGDDDSE